MSYKDIIDVSRYHTQGTIDWEQLVGKIGGAMLKTVSTNKSFGGIYIDPPAGLSATMPSASGWGIPVGVYYYTYAQTKATADAELAKLHEALTGKSFELPMRGGTLRTTSSSRSLPPPCPELVAYAGRYHRELGACVCYGVYLHLLQQHRAGHGRPGRL